MSKGMSCNRWKLPNIYIHCIWKTYSSIVAYISSNQVFVVFFFSRRYWNLSWEWWWLSKESLVHSIRSIWTSWPIQLKYWEIGRQVRDVETSRNFSFSYITKRWQGFWLFRSSRVKMQFYIFERFHYAFLQQDLIIPQEQALSASSERHFTYCKHENHSQ